MDRRVFWNLKAVSLLRSSVSGFLAEVKVKVKVNVKVKVKLSLTTPNAKKKSPHMLAVVHKLLPFRLQEYDQETAGATKPSIKLGSKPVKTPLVCG